MNCEELYELYEQMDDLVGRACNIIDDRRHINVRSYALSYADNVASSKVLLETYVLAVNILEETLGNVGSEKERFDYLRNYKKVSDNVKSVFRMVLHDTGNTTDLKLNKLLNERIDVYKNIIEWIDTSENRIC